MHIDFYASAYSFVFFFFETFKKYKYLDEYSMLRKSDDINQRWNKCEAFSRYAKWNVMNKNGTFEEIMFRKKMWKLFQNVISVIGILFISVFEILISVFTFHLL